MIKLLIFLAANFISLNVIPFCLLGEVLCRLQYGIYLSLGVPNYRMFPAGYVRRVSQVVFSLFA